MNEPALELFRKACGLNAPFALDCQEASRPTAAFTPRIFDCPFALLGREPRSDLFLDDAQVSRRHAFLQAIAGRMLVVDLHSRAKVYWEGADAPTSRGWLDPGCFIRVGPYRIRWNPADASLDQHDFLSDSPPPWDEERLESSPVPRAALESPIRIGDAPSLWPVEGHVAMVGRSGECQLVLTNKSISRFHAALVTTPSGVWVVDLAAREGVYVNGECVRWAWLADNDTLRMGAFTFILRYETPPAHMTRQDVPLEAGAASPEHPGTELAVRSAQSDNDRSALAVRTRGPSPVERMAASSPPAVEPAALVAYGGQAWEPSIPYPSNPMAMWQQQMQLMESFHNDMILMVQMFVAMHREHVASVRHELDMVQKLTRELGALQAKMAQGPGSDNPALTACIDRTSQDRQPAPGTDRKHEGKKQRSDRSDRGSTRPEAQSAESRDGFRAAGSKSPAAKAPLPSESGATPAGENTQMHAHLTERIAQLQRERQGYWQRILSSINR